MDFTVSLILSFSLVFRWFSAEPQANKSRLNSSLERDYSEKEEKKMGVATCVGEHSSQGKVSMSNLLGPQMKENERDTFANT